MMPIRSRQRGFTLIEILVVIAIAAILMGLVLAPVIQSFGLTRRAQAMADAQQAARSAMNTISREIGQAMYVYDNASVPVQLFDDGVTDRAPYGSSPAGPIMLPVQQPGGAVQGFVLPFAKIDMYPPKTTMHCNAPDDVHTAAMGSRDYPRRNEAWPPCPKCGSTEVDARPKLPLEQDVTIVRYFLALRYNNPSPVEDETPFGWRSPWEKNTPVGEGNQVVLYRAEFSPYDDTLFPEGMTIEERLSDPIFFYREEHWERWQQVSRVIGLGKYEDLVVATRNAGGGVIAVKPCVTFRTSAIDNDTFSGAYSSDRSFEYPDAVPAVYRATYGYWTPDFRVTVYRDDYQTAFATEIDSNGDLIISKWTQNGSNWDVEPHFNISRYLSTGEIANMQDPADPVEMAFTVDANRGTVNFGLQPPGPDGKATTGPICELDPRQINQNYHDIYRQERVAVRTDTLSTFLSSSGSSVYQPSCRVVPGSEQIAGPNMTPSARGGNTVRYERVPITLGDAGLDQYKIDYDQGQIYFSPLWDQDIPETGPIQAYYKIQFNRKDDVVRGDYSTKSLIGINVEMRVFDPDSGKAHPVDLRDSVKVRNALR